MVSILRQKCSRVTEETPRSFRYRGITTVYFLSYLARPRILQIEPTEVES